MISRVMGFIRDILIADLFGVSAATDAFFVAFKIPNFLRRLFAEGAFAHAFVPVLTDYRRRTDPKAYRLFIARMTGTLAVVQIVLSLVCILAAPVLIAVFAPGFLWEAGQLDLAVQMLRITFPFLPFISLTALAGGVLNAHGRFAVPALTPVLLNLCMIAAALWLAPQLDRPILALAWGVLAAGIVQLLFQIPPLLRLGLLPRPRLGFADAGVRRVIALMGPAVFGVSVVQVNLLVDTLFASFLPSGSVSWLYYSDRLVEFPLGIFGVAVSAVVLPSLAGSHTAENPQAFSRALDWGLRLSLLIGLPATLGLVLLADPLLSTLFQYNQFDAEDVVMAGRSLTAFALGLLAVMLIKLLAAGYTARHDTATPMRHGLYAMAVNVAFNAMLLAPLAHAGPALATSLAAYANAGLLLRGLLRGGVYRPEPGWPLLLFRVGLAAAAMAVCLYYFVDARLWLAWSAYRRGLGLAAAVALGMLVYPLVLFLAGFRLADIREPGPQPA